MVNAASPSIHVKSRVRQIERSDFGTLVSLLARGFVSRTESYWRHVLSRLEAHPTPAGYPKYGYLLESDGVPVGAILQIFVTVENAGEPNTRCYLSSWYVEPAFRSYASLLVSAATRRREVTYVNVSPDPRTWPIIEAQGFVRYSNGQYRAVPLLSGQDGTTTLREIRVKERTPWPNSAPVSSLLMRHAEYGCLSLVCEAPDGDHPFVFQVQRIIKGFVPCAQLVYCRDVVDLTPFARPLGVFLLRRGITCVSIDANAKIAGLVGRYFAGKAPKYCKGPHPPRQGDLAYTESVLFALKGARRTSLHGLAQRFVESCAKDQ